MAGEQGRSRADTDSGTRRVCPPVDTPQSDETTAPPLKQHLRSGERQTRPSGFIYRCSARQSGGNTLTLRSSNATASPVLRSISARSRPDLGPISARSRPDLGPISARSWHRQHSHPSFQAAALTFSFASRLFCIPPLPCRTARRSDLPGVDREGRRAPPAAALGVASARPAARRLRLPEPSRLRLSRGGGVASRAGSL